MKNRPTRDEETDWICRSVNGDVEAFGRLVEVYQDRVYNLSYRLTHHRDKAWDLSQEAFMKAFAAIGNFKGEAKFYTWIYRIVLNLHMNMEKSMGGKLEKRSVSMDCPRWDENGPSLRDEVSNGSDCDPSSSMVQAERKAAVQRAIMVLPFDQKQVVLLRDMEGLSYEEISEIISIPVGTVRSRLHRAREELKRRLKGVV